MYYACDELKADREVVLTAVKTDVGAIRHADEKLVAELREEGLLKDN